MDLVPRFDPNHINAIEAFLRAKVLDVGFDGVVLGLSGGLDSTVVVGLAKEVFGPENILAISMPECDSPSCDTDDAKVVAEWAGVDFTVIPIDEMIAAYRSKMDFEPEPMVLGNLKARIRMSVIYSYANQRRRLVLGTSNKSELLVGYFTKYGDGGSDVAPIGDLFKTQVKELAAHIGVPQDIISKPPTAGLVPNQTDEGELGVSYAVLDQMLVGFERDLSDEAIANWVRPGGAIDQTKVTGIRRMVDLARHKRKFPKVPKLQGRTVGWDRRE